MSSLHRAPRPVHSNFTLRIVEPPAIPPAPCPSVARTRFDCEMVYGFNEARYCDGCRRRAETRRAELVHERAAKSFADWIDSVAGEVASKDSAAATWLASKIREVAEQARYLSAETPDDFDAREEVLAKQYAEYDKALIDDSTDSQDLW